MTQMNDSDRVRVFGRRGLVVAAALAATAGWALAVQPGDPGGGPPLLTGPQVERTRDPDSLVHRGFDGEMERLPEMAEVAALRLLDLDEAARARVDRVLSERAAKVDAIVKQHLPAVQSLGEARRAGDRASMREPMREIREALKPLAEEGPLVEVVAGALPEGARAKYRELVAEYHAEALRERMTRRGGPGMGGPGGAGGPPEMGGPGGPLDELGMEGPGEFEQIPDRPQRRRGGPPDERAGNRGPRGGDGAERPGGQRVAGMQSMMIEVQQSYMRIVGDLQAQKDEFDGVLDGLDLTPEQRGKIEGVIAEARAKREVGSPPDRAQRGEMLRAIAQELSPEQRRALREALGGRRGGEEPRERGQRQRPGRPAQP
jgi:hypothetical protein